MLLTIGDILDLTKLREIQREVEAAEFHDGRLTAGFWAKKVEKNEQIQPGQTELGEKIRKALLRNAEFKRSIFLRKVRPPLVSRYKPGMEYGSHVDDALMGTGNEFRSDVSITVFLNDPGDYDGGELEIDNAFGPQQVKLPAVTWVQSQIRDPQKREVLYDLGQVRTYLHQEGNDAHATDQAFKAYSNLLRSWSEP